MVEEDAPALFGDAPPPKPAPEPVPEKSAEDEIADHIEKFFPAEIHTSSDGGSMRDFFVGFAEKIGKLVKGL